MYTFYAADDRLLIQSAYPIFRGMRQGADARPTLGSSARTLGVRPGIDIHVDHNGIVHPGTGGMSASPGSPFNLPDIRRPPKYGGMGRDPVWSIDTSELGPNLRYRLDPGNPSVHGFIEPANSMSLEEYQQSLWATRDTWRLVDP